MEELESESAEQYRSKLNAKYSCDLTRREFQVLSLVAKGMANSEIANKLMISEGTMKTDYNKITDKLAVAISNFAQLESRDLNSRQAKRDILKKTYLSVGDSQETTVNAGVREAMQESFSHRDVFWNPRQKPEATALKHALALQNTSVLMVRHPDSNAVDATLSFHMTSQGWRSVGDDQAPWIHVDFLDDLGRDMRVEGSKHWAVLEFDYHEDKVVALRNRVFVSRFADVKGVKVWLGAGYAQRDPEAPRESDTVGMLVLPIMQMRAFVSRFCRRLRRVFGVPKSKV